jgi:dolichol-phosphate mannosyltransferase
MAQAMRIIPTMIAQLAAGTDLAIGTRQTMQSDRIFSSKRSSASRLATHLAIGLLGARVSDPMSGFFAIRRRLFNEVAPGLADTGFKILLDLLTTAPRPLVIEEVMYEFRHREAGKSKFGVRVALDYLGLVVHKLSGGLLPHRFLLFCLVGFVGVSAHLAVLRVLLNVTPLSFVVCQVLTTYLTMTVNFTLNNLLTYQDMVLRGNAALPGCSSCRRILQIILPAW